MTRYPDFHHSAVVPEVPPVGCPPQLRQLLFEPVLSTEFLQLPAEAQPLTSEAYGQDNRRTRGSVARVAMYGTTMSVLFGGTAAAGMHMTSLDNPTARTGELSPEAAMQFKELDIDQAAIQRTEAALAARFAGDTEALDAMIAASEYGKPHLDRRYWICINNAQTQSEVSDLMNELLDTYNVRFAVPRRDFRKTINGVVSGTGFDALPKGEVELNLKRTKAVAKGVFRVFDRFEPLLGQPDEGGYVIQVVDEAFLESIAPNKTIRGIHFSGGGDTTKAIAIATDWLLADDGTKLHYSHAELDELIVHELAHRLQGEGIDPSEVDRVKPEDATYDLTDNGIDDNSSNQEVGVHAISDHATDSIAEATAEIFEHASSSDRNEPFEINSGQQLVLDQSINAVLAQLEAKTPGIAAYLLRDAKVVTWQSMPIISSAATNEESRKQPISGNFIIPGPALLLVRRFFKATPEQ